MGTRRAFINTEHIEFLRGGDRRWLMQTGTLSVKQYTKEKEWEELHYHYNYREMSKATGTKKTSENQRAKALWAMKAAWERCEECYDPLAEQTPPHCHPVCQILCCHPVTMFERVEFPPYLTPVAKFGKLEASSPEMSSPKMWKPSVQLWQGPQCSQRQAIHTHERNPLKILFYWCPGGRASLKDSGHQNSQTSQTNKPTFCSGIVDHLVGT